MQKIRWARECNADQVLDLLKGRWRLNILGLLAFEGPVRFNRIQKKLRNVSPQSLAQTLLAMRKAKLINRNDYKTKPPRVEYSLTPRGRSLTKIVHLMHVWRDRG